MCFSLWHLCYLRVEGLHQHSPQILIHLTTFMSTHKSMRILFETSFLTNLRFSCSLWIADILYHCTPVLIPVSEKCKKKKKWLVDLLHWNPHWWSLLISSIYKFNIERRILDNIFMKLMAVYPVITTAISFIAFLVNW
jgi:hypothetical protein